MCELQENPCNKEVKYLLKYKFYIPSYQRAYRWTKKEIEDLLNDLYDFGISSGNNSNKYCLQPLLVKKIDETKYEVVDGQQRLTTIYIILKYFQHITNVNPYQFEYETRENYVDYLQHINENFSGIISDDINKYHISNAYATIKNWIGNKTKELDEPSDFTIITDMYKIILNNVFFIWYEIPDEDGRIIFDKVNLNKINLTNADLIKALIFNEDNFNGNKDLFEIEQQEFANIWDTIEKSLQNDSLWYFLTEKQDSKYESRIDLLFELLVNEYNTEYRIDLNNNKTFKVYYLNYKNSNNKHEFICDFVKKLNSLYEQLIEWYNNIDLYHIIGYLISSGVSINTIFNLTIGDKLKKSEGIKALVEKTKNDLRILDYDELQKLEYGDTRIKKVLLLFNIATLVCKNDKQFRFQFDIFKKEKWDIEHIHATADETADSDNSLGNLTLLNMTINRGFKNVPFKDKRAFVIRKDSECRFLPICTRNIYSKYYSEQIENMDTWDDNDKNNYINAIWNGLKTFWEGGYIK